MDKLVDWCKAYLKISKEYIKFRNRKMIFLICTPIHNNLGDHAITIAAIQFLEKIMKGVHIIEIPQPYIRKYTFLFRWLTKGRTVFICGGGYIGTMWPDDNQMVTDVIKYLKNCKMIVLPQTMFYENKACTLLAKDQKVYSKHKNLTLCVRDEQSIQWAEILIKGKRKIILTPDLVTTLRGYDNLTDQRHGILLCLRNDIEKVFFENEYILEVINSYQRKVTVLNNISRIYPIMPENRKKIVEKHLKKIAKAEMLITDRLHGMLFATITGTPCIAFNNKSKKVQGGYNWIKNNKYVQLVENKEEFEKAFQELLNIKKSHYDIGVIENKFDDLKRVICSMNRL